MGVGREVEGGGTSLGTALGLARGAFCFSTTSFLFPSVVAGSGLTWSQKREKCSHTERGNKLALFVVTSK